MTKPLCAKCETFLLDLLETVEFDISTGCWLETSRTPLFSISRAYMTYICGKDIAGADSDLTKIAVCPWYFDQCCNPEHLRPGFYDEVTDALAKNENFNFLARLPDWYTPPRPVFWNFN